MPTLRRLVSTTLFLSTACGGRVALPNSDPGGSDMDASAFALPSVRYCTDHGANACAPNCPPCDRSASCERVSADSFGICGGLGSAPRRKCLPGGRTRCVIRSFNPLVAEDAEEGAAWLVEGNDNHRARDADMGSFLDGDISRGVTS